MIFTIGLKPYRLGVALKRKVYYYEIFDII